MKISETGEFELIERVAEGFGPVPDGSGIIGIGDDCAVIPQNSGLDTLVSADMLIEGTHFLLHEVDPWQLGWKSAAVNISDIAAMGGKPTGTLLSISLPRDIDVTWVDKFIGGYKAVSSQFGAALLGGDTTASPDRLCINVSVLGCIEKGKSRLRSSACPGDLICVSGHLGDSAAGLDVILHRNGRADSQSPLENRLVERHYHPVPRVKEGFLLADCAGVHAMMDISDGIASDLRHILKASAVSAQVDLSSVPLSDDLLSYCALHPDLDPVRLAVCGGEDYELLFTLDPDFESELKVPHFVIGRITHRDSSCSIEWTGREENFDGFRHF